jgi:FAD-dependent urate hydroxylase
VRRAERRRDGRVELTVKGPEGSSTIVTDHVIAGTGYQVDIRRLPFLSAGLRSEIRTIQGQPVLSANFESSLPGLYFAGVMAAATFGPVMRFLAGARYTAERLSRHLADTADDRRRRAAERATDESRGRPVVTGSSTTRQDAA